MKKIDNTQLTSKDKRYIQQVEKSLASFDSLDEWADFIAFLSRLHKALQVIEDKKDFHTVDWIPHSSDVANKLALCLSSRLPNGVHQKTLSLYESIFNSLKTDTFNEELSVWLPGLFPLLSYCSIQVKPQLIRIFKNNVLSGVYQDNLKIMTKPFMLSLLSGLDDESSEVFGDVMSLMDQFKAKLADDSHFWQTMFLCIISNPEKRLGALHWCNKRLPVYSTIRNGEKDHFSDEAQASLNPEPGLLIRAFATSINPNSANLNYANDVIVIRGFFDLLLVHLPLDSKVYQSQVSQKDKELLIMACSKVTLKKDMSLNRRLWNFFLGPETDPDNDSSSSRSKYFEEHALDTLVAGLLKMTNSTISRKIEAFKISLSIIMDKWEISSLVTPRLFSPFLETCHEYKNSSDILVPAQAFFDGIESSYIWSYIVGIILEENDNKLGLLEFVLSTFNCNEEEMITLHTPLAIMCLLATSGMSSKKISILEILFSMTPQRAFKTLTGSKYNRSKEEVTKLIKDYYHNGSAGESAKLPFSGQEISFLITQFLEDALIDNIKVVETSSNLCSLFSDLLSTIPKSEGYEWKSDNLTNSILALPVSKIGNQKEILESNSLIALGVTKVFKYISKSLPENAREKILKLILTNLWPSVYRSYPSNYQVEVVKAIYELEISSSRHSMEAGILELILSLPKVERVKAFSTLWTHSSSINEGDLILIRPLQVILDELDCNANQAYLVVCDFINNAVKDGTSNRLMKLITTPLLSFDLMNADHTEISEEDDLGRFAYYMKIILDVCKTNPKTWREAFSHELAVMDSGSKLHLVKSNNWDISTYKSLVCSVITNFFNLKLSSEVTQDQAALNDHYNCVSTGLELLSLLISGNESDFISYFYSLLVSCSYYFGLEKYSYTIELIQVKYLKCIFHFLELSESGKINLRLLHVEDEGKDSLMISFLINGITNAHTSLLLENWLSLLTRSLYLFNESVFSVLLTLNDCVIKKIDNYLSKLVKQEAFDDLEDAETAINTLISGLESLLSISHSFLLASSVRFNNDKANNNNETGFFGSVIQGVFSIESPAIRTTEQNKMYSILLSFQDAVRVCFKLWEWADSRPYNMSESLKLGDRSQIFLANKLKFKARRMLESLMELEKQEVIETLVYIDESVHTTIKLLNILGGGRPQVTLPNLLNSITARCCPQLLDESKKSAMNIPLGEKDLSKFLVSYFESLDIDSISDIWAITIQFFKDVSLHSGDYKLILPDCLKLMTNLSLKLSKSKMKDDRKNKKELSEVFIKILSSTVSGKSSDDHSDSEKDIEEENKDTSGLENSLILQDEVFDALFVVLEHLDLIVADPERASSSLNVIIANLVKPQFKSRKINEISIKTLMIVDLIGKYSPNKTWKGLVTDSFMDSRFFTVSLSKLKLWNSIITTWSTIERERIVDLISRITPLVSTTPSNIFIWNENSEIENKIQSLRRITYLILIQPKDYFLNHLDSIFDKIEDSLNASCPPSYRSELLTLLRAITLKFSELHLLPRWTVICHELTSVFESLASKSVKDLTSLNEDELKLVLSGCKLLDQLLLLGCDEFNLNEWLYVSSSPEAMVRSSRTSMISVIDRISKEKDLTILKISPIKVDSPQGNLLPLLSGVKSISSITELRLFFDYLSFIHYERTFGLYDLDFEACEFDVLNDLL